TKRFKSSSKPVRFAAANWATSSRPLPLAEGAAVAAAVAVAPSACSFDPEFSSSRRRLSFFDMVCSLVGSIPTDFAPSPPESARARPKREGGGQLNGGGRIAQRVRAGGRADRCAVIVARVAPSDPSLPQTVAESSGYTRTSRHVEVLQYIERLAPLA